MTAPLHRDCRGGTAVEFALLLPVLFALLLGTLEFGRALWMRQDMQFAVEEAARYALANDTASTTVIAEKAQSRVVGAGSPVTVTVTSNAAEIEVSASADFSPLVPGLLPSGVLSLTAHSRLPR